MTGPRHGAASGAAATWKGAYGGYRPALRSGRPSLVPRKVTTWIRRKAEETACWTAGEVRKPIRKRTGIRYGISGVRKVMRFWVYSQKVSVRGHVRRASPDAIAMFQEWARHVMPKRISEGHAAAIQDGVIVTDDARSGRRMLPRTYSLRHMEARTSCS